jgi:hypothetical protein
MTMLQPTALVVGDFFFHIFNWFVYFLLPFKCYLASASPLEEVLASFVKKGRGDACWFNF